MSVANDAEYDALLARYQLARKKAEEAARKEFAEALEACGIRRRIGPSLRERIAIRAARLRVTCDRKLGHTTPTWVTELAQRPLEPS